MKIISGINNIKRLKNPVVVLGVFDGVHLGHRLILRSAVLRARSIKGKSVVLTFWPHPQKKQAIYSLKHRLNLIASLGIDAAIVINFSPGLAKLPAEDFIRDILVKRLGAREIFIGRNFHFGKGAEGDYKTLERLSGLFRYKIKVFDVIKIGKKPVSSTYIRALIKEGKLDSAKKFLGRRVSVLGTVVKGVSLARHLGFPTANINPHHEVLPPQGIYAVNILLNKKIFGGACYIGDRPTFKKYRRAMPDFSKKNIEVYIFGLNKNIYGKYLEVQFIKKIRGDKKFPDVAALVKQVKTDIRTARRIVS